MTSQCARKWPGWDGARDALVCPWRHLATEKGEEQVSKMDNPTFFPRPHFYFFIVHTKKIEQGKVQGATLPTPICRGFQWKEHLKERLSLAEAIPHTLET